MRKKEFAARIWAKLMAYERRMGFLLSGDRVLAAVSGGPDSVCLAHYLSVQARRRGFWLGLVHVHHGLRGGEADEDAAFVRRLSQTLGAEARVVRVPTASRAKRRRKGIEDAARELRYKAFTDAAQKFQCNKIATAHQADDQAETVLLHLLRGTRLEALAAIPPRRPLAASSSQRRRHALARNTGLGQAPGVEVIRPLLCLRREEVLEYLRQHGLAYRTDRSNRRLDFTRNWIRRKVLPLLETRQPRVREHLTGIADQVRDLGRDPSGPAQPPN